MGFQEGERPDGGYGKIEASPRNIRNFRRNRIGRSKAVVTPGHKDVFNRAEHLHAIHPVADSSGARFTVIRKTPMPERFRREWKIRGRIVTPKQIARLFAVASFHA